MIGALEEAYDYGALAGDVQGGFDTNMPTGETAGEQGAIRTTMMDNGMKTAVVDKRASQRETRQQGSINLFKAYAGNKMPQGDLYDVE